MQSFYRTIGLMSGSSCDGLDIACVDFNHDGQDWSFECIATDCITYTKEWQDHLRQAATISGHDLMLLHSRFGQFCGQAVKEFINAHQLTNIDFVASHGHTIFHFPQHHFTTQIGDGAAIAAYCGLPVICDFRSTDIAKNGQGAPLVPMGDALLFKEYRFLLNIGGIANITIQDATQRTAFDICVANQVLNYLASHCGKEFDQDGILASQGRIDHALLQALHRHPYYQKPAPKSLGNEFMQENIKPLLQSSGPDPKDQLHTMCHFIVEQITTSLRHANAKPQDKMLVSGGGASNGFLIGLLKDAVPCEVIIPSAQIIAYKEALIFAFLGVLRWRQETNISAKITGADHDSCGGAIYLA